jgi:hypothetical protein
LFLVQLLNDNQIAYELKQSDHYFIPSKNSTIVFKRPKTSILNKEINQVLVWEDLWIYKNEIIVAKICSYFGLLKSIPARLCKVRRLDRSDAELFLNLHHLQGYVSSKLKYGLFLSENYQRLTDVFIPKVGLCVAVMTFSGKRTFRDGSKSYEMTRVGSLKNIRVVGGFSKMMKTFLQETNADHVMTYIDRDWSEGDNLEKLGFEKTGFLEPIFYSLNEDLKRVKVDNQEQYDVYNAGSVKMEWKKR